MKKLFLTSFVFTTGENEYEEQRLVVAPDKDSAYEMAQAWFPKNYPESTLNVCITHEAIENVEPDHQQETEPQQPEPEKDNSGYSGIKFEYNYRALLDYRHSVFFVKNDDPDNAVVAGYGASYTDALFDFANKLCKKGEYRINESLNFERIYLTEGPEQ